MQLKAISTHKIKDQTVLLRTDFNVPLNQNQEVTDTSRILASIPTIKDLLNNNNKIIIVSHLGRPNGTRDPQLSLKPILTILESELKLSIGFLNKINKPEATELLAKNQIILLENIRFWPGEETNNPELAKDLASLASVYVNDAFSVCHRSHCSVSSITKILPSYAGLLLEHEVKSITQITSTEAKQPFTLLLGGAKVKTKLPLIKHFLNKAAFILLGGVTANTVLTAQEKKLGTSKIDTDQISSASQILNIANTSETQLLTPTDAHTANLENPTKTTFLDINNITSNQAVLDIGPQTIKNYKEILGKSQTIIFNGPLGWSEHQEFIAGTKTLLSKIANQTHTGATTLIGGGDSIALLKKCNLTQSDFTHVSLGGGAMLEFLTNHNLPGLIPLVN